MIALTTRVNPIAVATRLENYCESARYGATTRLFAGGIAKPHMLLADRASVMIAALSFRMRALLMLTGQRDAVHVSTMLGECDA
jgi:hypothetical protein